MAAIIYALYRFNTAMPNGYSRMHLATKQTVGKVNVI